MGLRIDVDIVISLTFYKMLLHQGVSRFLMKNVILIVYRDSNKSMSFVEHIAFLPQK